MSETVGSILRDKGHHVWSVSPGDSVFQAISLMADKGVGVGATPSSSRSASTMMLANVAVKMPCRLARLDWRAPHWRLPLDGEAHGVA